MTCPRLLRAFVNERLSAAAEEIFLVFEKALVKYEEEASSSQQEIQRLRGLLQEFTSQPSADLSVPSPLKEEFASEQQHGVQDGSPSSPVEEPESQHIKEEAHEYWNGEDQEKEEEKEIIILPNPLSCVSESEKQKSVDLQGCKEKAVQEQKQKAVQVSPSVISKENSQTWSQRKNTPEKRELEEPAGIFVSDQTQTNPYLQGSLTDFPQNSPQDHQCFLCNQSFPSSQDLHEHTFRLHSNNAGVQCTVCGKTLESTESFIIHLQSHEKSKCCYVCGKHCSCTTNLTEHMARHAGVKLHRCHICGRECSRKGDLKIHMRIHTGEKPFFCSFCSKSFTHSGHLKKHMRSHTGERPHRCHICGRSFLQSVHLKGHLRTHTHK